MYGAGGIKSIGRRAWVRSARPPGTEFGMARLLVAALILAEIATLILVGQAAGVLLTLLLVIAAALGGAALLRRQGSDALAGMRGALNRGRDPRPALLRGGFRLAGRAAAHLSGFFSDAAALLLLLPPVQGLLTRRFQGHTSGFVVAERYTAGPMNPRHEAPRDRVVDEADWEEVTPPKRPTHRPSGWTRH
jgi:UPF0716 protein FxsA